MVDVLFFNPPRSRQRDDHVVNTAMLWLASGLIGRGHEAVVRLPSGANLNEEIAAYIEADRPRYVAIACKWWNTLHGAMEVARAVRRSFPRLPIVTGGHTASTFPRELIATGLFDIVLLGDVDDSLGELVAHEDVCHGYTATGYHPPRQGTAGFKLDEVELAPLERLTDRPDMVPGYVWTGRGCSQTCFYCVENRESGARILGRTRPRLRNAASVARDVDRLCPHSQLIFDYEHPSATRSARFMAELVEHLPARMTSCYYFHWGLPTPELLDVLASSFDHVGVCLDIQSFAESHRRQLADQGLIKPYFDERAIAQVIEHAARRGNVAVDATGIIGMPFETAADRERACSGIERLMADYECVRDWRFSPLHVIPGTPLAAHERFHDLTVVRRTFEDFVAFTQEGYETELPYYSRERRHHPYGVHPAGKPQEIVDFMAEADARLTAARGAKRDVFVDAADGEGVIGLEDPYTPLPSLFRMLDDPRLTEAGLRRLTLRLGPRTWFHHAWADYTSESGENSATRCDAGKSVAALDAALAEKLGRFRQVVLEPAGADWGIVSDVVSRLGGGAKAGIVSEAAE